MRTLIFAACAVCTLNYAFGQEHGIINTSRSPHVKLRSVDIGDCRWTEGFWADKFKLCEQVMVPHMGTLLKGDVGHAYDNFKIVAGLKEGEHHGTNWHDGDFYKWMEAATYIYAMNQDPAIIAELDAIIGVIGQAQAEDGYLHTAVMLKGLGRYTNRQHHEMYNSGHLLTAACIHHRVTGKRNFLDIAVKHADHLVRTFGPQPKELARFGFNQTQITGLVELYRTTRNKEYLRLAGIFINMRGRSKPEPDDTAWYKMVGDMVQERVPLRKETEAVGHAVLALYYYAGAADVYAETGEQALDRRVGPDLGEHRRQEDVRDWRMRPDASRFVIPCGFRPRGVHQRIHDAQPDGLQRDVRQHLQRHVQLPLARYSRREQVRGCDGIGVIQQRVIRHQRGWQALLLHQSAAADSRPRDGHNRPADAGAVHPLFLLPAESGPDNRPSSPAGPTACPKTAWP